MGVSHVFWIPIEERKSLICQINAVLDSNRILLINPEVGTTAETCLHSLNPRNTSWIAWKYFKHYDSTCHITLGCHKKCNKIQSLIEQAKGKTKPSQHLFVQSQLWEH